MVFKTNKEKGNSGLGIAIAYFTSNGYTVSLPLNDTQDYDLIIEKNRIIKTVQVKATGCKGKSNSYQVALKSCGGNKGTTYKTLINSFADILFILTSDMKTYCIPCNIIKNTSTLNLPGKYLNFEVFLFDKQIYS